MNSTGHKTEPPSPHSHVAVTAIEMTWL